MPTQHSFWAVSGNLLNYREQKNIYQLKRLLAVRLSKGSCDWIWELYQQKPLLAWLDIFTLTLQRKGKEIAAYVFCSVIFQKQYNHFWKTFSLEVKNFRNQQYPSCSVWHWPKLLLEFSRQYLFQSGLSYLSTFSGNSVQFVI